MGLRTHRKTEPPAVPTRRHPEASRFAPGSESVARTWFEFTRTTKPFDRRDNAPRVNGTRVAGAR
jgi:hypothetical protein